MRFNNVLLIAGLIAVLAAFGIYVIVAGQGNGEGEIAQAEKSCPVTNAYKSEVAKAFVGDVAALRPVEVGVDLSDLIFTDDKGQKRALGEWRGKTVLLNLWATWCAPCREEMPALEKLEETMGGKKFSVVPVSIDLDTPEKALSFYQAIGLSKLPFFHEGELEIFNRLKKQGLAFGMPTTLLIDANSCVLGVMNGPANWAGPDAQALVRTALDVQPNP